MNKRQKLVQAQFLNNEEEVIRRLESIYGASLKDIEKKTQALQDEINRLGTMAKLSVDDAEKAQLLSMQQSKIYQKQYQDAMKKQIGSVLDNMQVEEFRTVSEYLQKCYEDGFVGTMFDLQGQGIPLCFPMDQEAMVRAVQLDSKISQGLYSRLGEDVALLKKKITAEVSRGIATGMNFEQVAKQLSGISNIGFNNAVRIARTEGHRIQVQGTMDACYKAKDKGADVVKQWDATLDSSTRESHAAVDGEIRELDEKFSNGLMFPGDPSGGAAEVVNCRCALLQRARWALDDDEVQTLKDRAEYFGLDKTENFDDYKSKYLKVADLYENTDVQKWESLKNNARDYYRVKDGDELQRETRKQVKEKLSKDDVANVKAYTGDGFRTYNAPLRKGGKIPAKCQQLSDSLDKMTLPQDMRLYRTINTQGASKFFGIDDFQNYGVDEIREKLVGNSYVEKAFCSTSIGLGKFNGSRGKSVKLDIFAPEGTKGMYVAGYSSYINEAEVLLKNGSIFNVHDVTEDENGIIHVVCEVLSQ